MWTGIGFAVVVAIFTTGSDVPLLVFAIPAIVELVKLEYERRMFADHMERKLKWKSYDEFSKIYAEKISKGGADGESDS